MIHSSLPFKPICLLWDVDGTLIDTTSLIINCLDFIYTKHFKKSITVEERKALIGIPLWRQIRIFGEPEDYGTTEVEVMQDFIAYYESRGDEETILTEVIGVLRAGKLAGLPTGLVTSKNRPELANSFPRLGITDCVDVVMSADDVVNPKPAPEGILKAMEVLGIKSSAAVCYIGDTTHDMRAASSAGVYGIGVTWGAGSANRLEEAGAQSIVNTPAELRMLLGL